MWTRAKNGTYVNFSQCSSITVEGTGENCIVRAHHVYSTPGFQVSFDLRSGAEEWCKLYAEKCAEKMNLIETGD